MAAVVSGCFGTDDESAPPLVAKTDIELIAAPEGAEYDLPVVLRRDARVIVALSPRGQTDDAAYDRLAWISGDGAVKLFPLPRRKGCKFTSADVPTRLPGNLLGFSEKCWGTDAPRRAVRLRSYDPGTRKLRSVVPYALPFSWSFFAVAPRGEVVINDGRGLEESLWLLTRAGPRRIDLPFDRVGYPRWSPDGRRLALDAVPEGEASGIDRLDAPRNLYLLDAEGEIARVLLRNATQVGPTAGSPDGRWLALAVKPASKPYGLYIVDSHAGDARLVLEYHNLGGVAWSSQRELIAAVGVFSHVEGADGDVGLYRIRLPDLDRVRR
jgi:dipeptidyl aminopeptidase/acylaminoacyl peptidase